MKDNTKRFSDRVANYSKYRPSYSEDAIAYLCEIFGLSQSSIVADIGSGTGIFTGLLLDKGIPVYAVEPNDAMRLEAEKKFKDIKHFVSIKGSAENTTLRSGSADIITVAQAFHWFNLSAAKDEFKRILRYHGAIILIWNKRRSDTDFLVEYENLLKSDIPEYSEVGHHNVTPQAIKSFFDKDYKLAKFANSQSFDWDGLIGRFNSSSYAPKEGTPEHAALQKKLKSLFEKHVMGGKISFNYEEEVYSGRFFY